MITDNANQSVFMVHDKGVVVIDAPPSYAKLLPEAIAEVTDKTNHSRDLQSFTLRSYWRHQIVRRTSGDYRQLHLRTSIG
jgi:hypothetical protein